MRIWILPLVTSLGIAFTTEASERAYLYKDPRIMGMGGANVASGGYSASMFSNPAGIANIPRYHGMVVELLGLSATASDDAKNIVDDITDAIDIDTTQAILDVFTKYSGQFVHVDVINYSSISMNSGDVAWSIGLLSATDVNLTPHANGGVNGGYLDTQSRAYGGLTTAYAKSIDNVGNGDLKLGIGAKFIYQKSYEGALSADDLINADDLADSLQEKFEKDGTGYSLDLGFIYEFYDEIPLKPAVGLSILNIGDLEFDGSYGGQPTTVNIGASIEPEIPYILQTRFAVDYMDLFNANSMRMYNLDSVDGDVTYTDVEDTDYLKHFRLGVSALLYDNSWSTFEMSTGVYQGNLTAGLDFTVASIHLGFSMFSEQLGPQYGDETDRRYSLKLGIAW